MPPPPLRAGLAVLLLATLPLQAQTAPAPPIRRVTLYPGSAWIERDVAVDASASRVELACLPASFDVASVRLEPEAGVQVGDVVIDTLQGPRAEPCQQGPLRERIRALENQRAEVDAEREANALVLGYLKQFSAAPSADDAGKGARAAGSLAVVSEALLRQGQEALGRQLKLQRRLDEIDRTLAPLQAERERSGGAATSWRTLRFAVRSARAASVRVGYETARAGWSPAYRASLDSTAGTVLLERQAVIAQRTGEDWRGVRLTLSTGRPQRAPAGPLPWTWSVDVAAPQKHAAVAALAMAPAPAPALADRMRADEPLFDVNVFQGSFATEFALAGGSDLASDGQQVTVSLNRSALPATWRVRATPRLDRQAYLVAEAERPPGVWPAGPLQLQRDGALVGTTPWRPADEARFSLPFGVDERVRIEIEGAPTFTESAGVFGGRLQQRQAVAYTVHNGHAGPVRLQLLEAGPVSRNEQVKVTSSFKPQPATDHWQDRAGVVAWEQTLAPGEQAHFSAEHLVSYPKEVQVTGLP